MMLQYLKRFFAKAPVDQPVPEKVVRSIKRRSYGKKKTLNQKLLKRSDRDRIAFKMKTRKNNVPSRALSKAWRAEAVKMHAEGMTYREIATMFSVTENAVYFALADARKAAA